VEIGPGKALIGFVKKTAPAIKTYAVETCADLDALSAALFQRVCELAEVPVQRFSNRPDLPGGSTLGNISSAHLSIPSVDIGLPQLAMHASCEVASVRDTQALVRAMTVYFGRSFRRLPDGGAAI